MDQSDSAQSSSSKVDQALTNLLSGYTIEPQFEMPCPVNLVSRQVTPLDGSRFAVIDHLPLGLQVHVIDAQAPSKNNEHTFSSSQALTGKVLACQQHKGGLVLVTPEAMMIWRQGTNEVEPERVEFDQNVGHGIAISQDFIAISFENIIRLWNVESTATNLLHETSIEGECVGWIAQNLVVLKLSGQVSIYENFASKKNEVEKTFDDEGVGVGVEGIVTKRDNKLQMNPKQGTNNSAHLGILSPPRRLRTKKKPGINSSHIVFCHNGNYGEASGCLSTTGVPIGPTTRYSAAVEVIWNGTSKRLDLPLPESKSRLLGQLFFQEMEERACLIVAISHPNFDHLQLFTIDVETGQIKKNQPSIPADSSLAFFPGNSGELNRYLLRFSHDVKQLGQLSVYDLAQAKMHPPSHSPLSFQQLLFGLTGIALVSSFAIYLRWKQRRSCWPGLRLG